MLVASENLADFLRTRRVGGALGGFDARIAIMTDYEWGPAEVTYPDWQGTFQIDEKLTGQESIYTWTGIDQDEWWIVGFDWGAGETGPHEPHAIVVPAGTNIEAEVERHGYLPARDLLLHDVEAGDLLLKAVHVCEFRVRSQAIVDTPVRIVALGDVPEQEI